TTDRPGPPSKPSVQDQNVDSVRLLWSAPTQDGGSPIRFYTVEMCKVSEQLWIKKETTKQPFITVFNLTPEETYKFRYIICEELGQGAYGTVHRAVEKATGKTWAAKMIQVRPGVKRDDVIHEILVMNELNHDKLLHLHEAFDLGNEMCLIEEFVSGGELFEKIMEDDSLMSEEEVRDYMHQILLGVQHMHKNQIVHLDLKPENILLKSKKSTDVKIIDFGLARKLDPKKSVKLLFGTPEFCAPEVVNYQPVGLCTDMWTLGVITYVLLSGLSPFLGDSDEETLANVSAADWDFDDPSWDDVSDVAKGPLLSAFNDLSEYIKKTQPSPAGRGPLPTRQKKNFLALKRWSDDLLPIGRLAKRGAIFRRLTMDGVFERNISFGAFLLYSLTFLETECAPSVKKQLEDIVANLDDLIATLSCDIGGVPEPHIAWLKDDKELLVPSAKYAARFTNGLAELTVKNIVESDEGRYSCRATNDLGSITTKATLTVATRKAGSSPAKLERRKNTEVNFFSSSQKNYIFDSSVLDGSTVGSAPPFFHLHLADCTAKICEQKILCVTNTTLPEPEVEWYHNGELIRRSDFRYLQKHDKGRFALTILSVTKDDEGMFGPRLDSESVKTVLFDFEGEWRAVGKNAYGNCESSCNLTVEIPDNFVAPSFDQPLLDIRSEEGDMMNFAVRVTANPAPLIIWYLDDVEIHHSKHHRIQFDLEKREYTLTVVSCTIRDSGEYRCVSKNVVGEAECSCHVRIGYQKTGHPRKVDRLKAPKFHMPLPNPRQIPEGAEMILTCVVTGVPQPNITWFKDGERLIGKDVKCENGVCTLTLSKVSIRDAGTYVCEAENIHGSARSHSIVEVTPPPEKEHFAPKFIELLANRSVFENEEIVLECSVTGKPTPTITWYKDGLKLMFENRMLHYTDRKGITRLNIMKATPRDSGEYTCEAANPLGKDFTHSHVHVNGSSKEMFLSSSTK
ncbi:immunoglobulin I-set domain protein, partial [Necator americanus]